VVAYRRTSNNRRLLSDFCTSWNIPIINFLSFIQADRKKPGNYGLDKNSLRSRGDIKGRNYIPESGLAFWAILD
jgi:hypothetical protein